MICECGAASTRGCEWPLKGLGTGCDRMPCEVCVKYIDVTNIPGARLCEAHAKRVLRGELSDEVPT